MATVSKRITRYKGEDRVTWVVRYTDISGVKRLKTFATKRDAEAGRRQIESGIETGAHVADRATVTFGEAIQAWLSDCDRRHKIGDNMSGNTLRGYVGYANNHVIPSLGKHRLTNLTSLHIQDFINAKAGRYARSSCVQMSIVISQSLLFAVRRRWLRRSPITDEPVSIPRTARRRKIVTPSREELAALLRVMTIRLPFEQEIARANRIAVITLALFGGLRLGEALGLQWESVDFAGDAIHVRHNLSRSDGLKEPKTKAGLRTIPMSPPVRRVLEEMADRAGPDRTGFIIRTRFGTPITNDFPFRYGLNRLMKAAGLVTAEGKPKYSLHALRHAFVSLMIAEGVDAFRIKNMVGHARITTTLDTYGHMFPEDQSVRMAVTAASDRVSEGILLEAPVVSRAPPATRADYAAVREEALAMLREGVTPQDVGRLLSVSPTAVYAWMRAAGIERARALRTTKDDQTPLLA